MAAAAAFVKLSSTAFVIILFAAIGGHGQQLNRAAIKFSTTDLFVWTGRLDYDPYTPLRPRQAMFSEYVLADVSLLQGNLELFMVFFDPAESDEAEKIRLREYFWAYVNASGALPGSTIGNGTIAFAVPFFTKPNDRIAFHCTYRASYKTNIQMRLTDLRFELPAGTGWLAKTKTLIELARFPLTRWRYSGSKKLLRWETIVNETMSLRPVFPPPSDNITLYHAVSAQDLRMIENPCATDLFQFYLISQSRSDPPDKTLTGPLARVFIMVPLRTEKENPEDWMEMTQVFCLNYTSDCAQVEKVVITNAHILALSNRGLFVSARMSDAPMDHLDYPFLPQLSMHLIDPCAKISDMFNCYTQTGINPLIHSITIHYHPICAIAQYPAFRDIVMIVISHDTFDLDDKEQELGFITGWSALWSEQPYVEWHLILRSVTKIGKNFLTSIDAAFYNHQLDAFNFVAYISQGESNPIRAYTQLPSGTPQQPRFYTRLTLAMPAKNQIPKYYKEISAAGLRGFMPFVFDRSFQFRKIQVTQGMDIHFIGNQIWVAEAGQSRTYLSVPYIDGFVDYCSFNKVDTMYACINMQHTKLYIGKVAADYRAYEMRVDELDEMRNLALVSGWWPKPYDEVDVQESMIHFISPNYKSLKGIVEEFLIRPILSRGLLGVFFRVSYQGQLQIWYLDAQAQYERESFRDEVNVTLLEDAKRICAATEKPEDCKTADQAFEVANKEVKAFLPDLKFWFNDLTAKAEATECRVILRTANIYKKFPFAAQPNRPPLVPFLVDGITVALYQYDLEGALGITRTDVGSTVFCRGHTGSEADEKQCELYIRHVKFLDNSWLPGFSAVIYTYAINSIPMHAFSCLTTIHANPYTNDVFIYIKKEELKTPTGCEKWSLADAGRYHHYIGWAFYIPGRFSVLITRPTSLTSPDIQPLTDREDYSKTMLFGRATKTFQGSLILKLKRYEGFFVNMATKKFQDTVQPLPESLMVEPETIRYPSLPSYYIAPTACLFDLQLIGKAVLKASEGFVFLDLHDSLSYEVQLSAISPAGEVMMQQSQLKITNSNPKILNVRNEFIKKLTTQSYRIHVKPTGFSTGQATVVVRTLTCIPACQTRCSVITLFQVMRADGRALQVHYPIKIPDEEIRSGAENITRNGIVIYKRLPTNYRPPSALGIRIPTAANIYNADPSKSLYKSTYKVSKVSGNYKHCKDKTNRLECGCSAADLLQAHPVYTDCRQMVYRVKRADNANPFIVKVTYPPLMNPLEQKVFYLPEKSSLRNASGVYCENSTQHEACGCSPADGVQPHSGITDCAELISKSVQAFGFFLPKPNLVVWVSEINNREDYKLESTTESTYLKYIQSDKQLHRGRRFFDADDLRFTLYGTGLYHFRAALGEFDSFGDVSGYILVYSEEIGLNDLAFMLICFATLIFCFLIMLCGFLRVRKRLMGHLPTPEIVDDGKITKVD